MNFLIYRNFTYPCKKEKKKKIKWYIEFLHIYVGNLYRHMTVYKLCKIFAQCIRVEVKTEKITKLQYKINSNYILNIDTTLF